MYFTSNKNLFKIVNENNDVFTTFQQNQSSSPDEKLKLDHFLKGIHEDIIYLYFTERINLLKIFYKISLSSLVSQQHNPLHKSSSKLIKDLALDTIKTIWTQYTDYNKLYKIVYKYNEELKLKENETLNIMKEQSILLDNLLMLINRKNYLDKHFFFSMLKAFDDQNFSGFVSKDLYADHSQEFIDEQKMHYSIIKDLCMLLLIQCFGSLKKNGDINDQKMPLSLLKSQDDINTLIIVLKSKSNKALSPLTLEFFMTMRQINRPESKIDLSPEINRTLTLLESEEFCRNMMNKNSTVNIFNYVSSIFERDIFSKNLITFRSTRRKGDLLLNLL